VTLRFRDSHDARGIAFTTQALIHLQAPFVTTLHFFNGLLVAVQELSAFSRRPSIQLRAVRIVKRRRDNAAESKNQLQDPFLLNRSRTGKIILAAG